MFDVTHSDTRPPRPLVTPRELEVLALVARGLSTSEIARALWITEDTVKTHVRRVHARLGARTRAHAVALAFSHGLLPMSPGTPEEVAAVR